MPYAQSGRVKLYYEETGSGYPIVFVHEFGADHRQWETQVRWFAREYRCIAYAARGYLPSDVPAEEEAYGYEHSVADIAAVMRQVGVPKAHVVGLSMGGYATLMFGLRHPDMASALVVAGCGSGSPREARAAFRQQSEANAEAFHTAGAPVMAQAMGLSPTRVQLQIKDPRGWQEFVDHLSEHSAHGSAMTLRRYMALRPSLADFTAELKRLTVPVLLAVGDEDEPCLETNLFLKRTIPSAGLWIAPKTGHAINLEEPAAFNRAVQDFFSTVERGRWALRDPRTIGPGIFGATPPAQAEPKSSAA
jgi:pimeloyl-ACP methyl ester carboxylesterase